MSSIASSTGKTTARRPVLWLLAGAGFVLLLAALWLFLLPHRLAASLSEAVEDETGLGMAVTGTSSIAAGNDGLEIRFAKVRMASPTAPSGLLIEIAELHLPMRPDLLFGAMAEMPNARADGAVINLDIGAPISASAAGGKSDASPSAVPTVQAFKLHFRNSTVNLFDGRSRFRMNIADANGVIERNAANELLVHLSGLLNGLYTTLHMEADDATRLFDDGSPADIVLSSDNGEMRFSGRAGWLPALALDGRVFAASRKARNFLSWLTLPATLAPETAFELEGALSTEGPEAKLPDFTWRLGSNGGSGELALTATAQGVAIDGKLHTDSLAFSPSWSRSTLRDEWNSQAYQWLPLPGFQGKLALDAKSLVIDDWSLTNATADVTLNDTGAAVSLTADVGKVSLDATVSRDTPPAFTLKAKLADAPARPVLNAMAGHSWLEGGASLDLDVTSAGNDAAAVVSSLAGSATLTLKDGRIDGYSLKDLLAESGKGWRAARGDQTKAVTANIAGTLNDGILLLAPSRIMAQDTDITASGEIDLLRQALDIKAGVGKRSPVNMVVSGPWQDPDFGLATAQSGQPPDEQPSAN